MVFKRCLIRFQKGVNKRLKGRLLQAKKPLIRTLFVPDWLADCENIWQTEWDKKTEWHRDIYFNDIFLHEDKSDKTTNDANCTNYITIIISVIRSSYHKVQCSNFKGKKVHIIKFNVQTSKFKGNSSKVIAVSLCHSIFFLYWCPIKLLGVICVR